MLTLIIKRIVVIAMAMVSAFGSLSSDRPADYCGEFDFPRIAAEPQQPGTIRIMSYNIRCGDVNGVQVKRRTGIGVRQILEVMPDSLGIQEATPEWMKVLDRELSLYDWVGIERETGGSPLKSGESCPIFYLKTRFTLEDSGNFWVSDTPDVPSLGPGAACKRICTWAKLRDRQTGREMVHVNTHYDHVSEQARVQGAEIITRFIKENFAGIPLVFTADMNTTEKGEAYAEMTLTLSDARTGAENSVSYGTFHGGKDPALCSDYYIDFLLYSSEFEAAAYRTVTRGVDDRFVSDHFPIYADLIIKE